MTIFIISCTEEAFEIKTPTLEQIGINEPTIRTVNVDYIEETQEIDTTPRIDIISPKDGELIKISAFAVKLNISNFKLVHPDRYSQQGQGHVQLLVDDMEYRGSKTEFVFENESDGVHVIKAELMLSNNTVLPYNKMIKIYINTTIS